MCNEQNGINGNTQTSLSQGEFYIGGFVLLTFIESFRLALNELTQYKTAYLELAFACQIL